VGLWPGILIGSCFTNAWVGNSLGIALGIAVGSTIGPVVTCTLLHRLGFAMGFPRRQDVLRFIVVATVGMLIPPTNGMFWLHQAGVPVSVGLWINWFAGDTIGVMLFAPVVLAWRDRVSALQRLLDRPTEAVVVTATVIALNALVFLVPHQSSIAFVTLLPLVWFVGRFGVWASSTLVMLVGLLSAWGTAIGRGPFPDDDLDPVILIAMYHGFLALMNLINGSLLMEHAQAVETGVERQRQLEAAMTSVRESEARWRTLVEHSPYALVVFDLKRLHFTDCNEAACRLLGYSREELLTRSPITVSPPMQPDGRASPEVAQAFVAQAVAGQTPRFEWFHRHADGHDIPCEITLVRLPSSDGPLIRGEIVDISERKRLAAEQQAQSERRQHAQRLESIGTLAGGIAHDFNNLLGGIIGSAETLLDENRRDHPQRVQTILQAGRRGRDLVRQILAFSRQQPRQVSVLDPRLVVQEAVGLLRATLPSSVTWDVRIADHLPRVRADAGQLHQVLMNLGTNAWQALPEGRGRIGVHADAYDTGGRTLVRLVVSDNGRGMSAEVQARAFEPFFTTKPVGQGTGMGLAVVFGIVKEHDGQVTLTSRENVGTRMEILLPATTAEPTPESSEIARDDTSPNHAEILLVDDEAILVDLGILQLERLGYRVIGTTDPQQAITLVLAEPARFALVITDLSMPLMSGLELARTLHAISPALPILLSSGFSGNVEESSQREAGITTVLDKPVESAALAKALSAILKKKGRS
jgi:PAS domain S-box-containing protein